MQVTHYFLLLGNDPALEVNGFCIYISHFGKSLVLEQSLLIQLNTVI